MGRTAGQRLGVPTRRSTEDVGKWEQQKDKFNLVVTEEMKAAWKRCEDKVNWIIKDCTKRNRCFRDREFDLEEDRDICLYGLEVDQKLDPLDVLRVTDIFRDHGSTGIRLFKEGATAEDLVQGELADCWILSALATVCTASRDYNWIEKEICVKHDVEIGVYGFIFYRDCGWVDIVVDDLLFVHSTQYENLPDEEKKRFRKDKRQYNQMARSGSKALYFASSRTEGEVWVPLIEKAFAKLYGDYSAINYGHTWDAVENLTGGVSNSFHLHDVLSKDTFWEDELSKMVNTAIIDRVFSCDIREIEGGEVQGLRTNHAYSVIKAIGHVATGKRFVKMRNPWGKDGEWNGPWSDGSIEWTSNWPSLEMGEEVRIQPEDLEHTFGNDGQFIMEYEDFMSTWTNVDRTRLFNDEWVYSSHWLNVATRPEFAAWSPGDVSFSIIVAKKTPAVIVLSRLDDRGFQELSGCYSWSLDFVVYREGPETYEVGRSTHERLWSRSVNVELDLEEGTYIVHVRLDRRHRDGDEADQDGYRRNQDRRNNEPLDGSSHAGNVYYTNQLKRKIEALDGSFYPDDVKRKRFITSLSYTKEVALRRNQWDRRKLEKKWAAAIASRSLASNFDYSSHQEMIPITYDFLAGRDLRKIQTEILNAERERANSSPVHLGAPQLDELTGERVDRRTKIFNGDGFICDHCGNEVGGPFWHCSVCVEFDICSKCKDKGLESHGGGTPHALWFIQNEEIAKALEQHMYGEGTGTHPEDREVIIGLRVYTYKEAKPEIHGSLRQGSLVRLAFKKNGHAKTGLGMNGA
ncbi:cysteine proteinase [Neolentinus lepideus HHB14362 ss-1]|uniref:Cysteine proteinase n=1 Tax=Neolentinus lepideus HHB14362 ss-1 TaxID=1314782 RepID=A0A165SLD8_9AGAM|nr:cysteine proteinase [Neolentinus lepideus HHB14362 ss-1]